MKQELITDMGSSYKRKYNFKVSTNYKRDQAIIIIIMHLVDVAL